MDQLVIQNARVPAWHVHVYVCIYILTPSHHNKAKYLVIFISQWQHSFLAAEEQTRDSAHCSGVLRMNSSTLVVTLLSLVGITYNIVLA